MKILYTEYKVKEEKPVLIKTKEIEIDSINYINSQGFWTSEKEGIKKLWVDPERFSIVKDTPAYSRIKNIVYNLSIPFLKNGKNTVHS